MATYVTVSDIDGEIGPGWASAESKPLHVKVVNAWLSSIIKKELGTVPKEVVQAAGLIAPLAAAGTLFKSSDREVKSKSAEAGGVKSSKTYVEESVARSKEENIAIALLSSITSSVFSTTRLRRV